MAFPTSYANGRNAISSLVKCPPLGDPRPERSSPISPPKNILLIAKGFPPDDGGIETYSYNVARAFAKSGSQVRIVTSTRGGRQPATNDFASLAVVPQRGQLSTALRMMKELVELKRTGFRPDLIHATSWRVAAIANVTWPRARMIVTVHGKEVFGLPGLLRRLASVVLARAEKLIFVSHTIRNRFLAEFPTFTEANTVVSWNGCTDFGKDCSLPAKEPSAIFTVCRLVERKNLHLALHALALVDCERYPFQYRLAGTGPLTNALQTTIDELGLADRVQMLGFLSDEEVAREYSRANLFLHPQIEAAGGTDVEGFGIALADAMRFGAVPIAGNNGGPKDFIRHKENGYLVSGHDPKEIATVLESALGDDSGLESIRASAEEFARSHFTWESHVGRIIGKMSVLG